MELKRMLTDDDAVSPVIGVILMVAITVILAAVIASFVLGLGNTAQNQTPTTSFTINYEKTDTEGQDSYGIVKVKHDGGDTIANNELYLRGNNFQAKWEKSSEDSGEGSSPDGVPAISGYDVPINTLDGKGKDGNPYQFDDATNNNDRYIGAPDTQWPGISATGDDSAVVSGNYIYVGARSDYSLSVVYQSQEGQSSATLQEDKGPDA